MNSRDIRQQQRVAFEKATAEGFGLSIVDPLDVPNPSELVQVWKFFENSLDQTSDRGRQEA
jgi:hypothetical protein